MKINTIEKTEIENIKIDVLKTYKYYKEGSLIDYSKDSIEKILSYLFDSNISIEQLEKLDLSYDIKEKIKTILDYSIKKDIFFMKIYFDVIVWFYEKVNFDIDEEINEIIKKINGMLEEKTLLANIDKLYSIGYSNEKIIEEIEKVNYMTIPGISTNSNEYKKFWCNIFKENKNLIFFLYNGKEGIVGYLFYSGIKEESLKSLIEKEIDSLKLKDLSFLKDINTKDNVYIHSVEILPEFRNCKNLSILIKKLFGNIKTTNINSFYTKAFTKKGEELCKILKMKNIKNTNIYTLKKQ